MLALSISNVSGAFQTHRYLGKEPRSGIIKAKAMASDSEDRQWVRFPHLKGVSADLMNDVAAAMDKHLGSDLHPTRTPADVRAFKSNDGNSEGSITLRAGRDGSKIDFVLGSWLHCNLPFGTLNISTMVGMLGYSTDAPHLLFEFIQTGKQNLVLVFDLLPRKDLVLDTEYLKQYYEDTEIENVRKKIARIPGSQNFVSSSLYVRSLVSPTAILLKFDTSEAGDATENNMDSIISQVHPLIIQAFDVWVDCIINRSKIVAQEDLLVLNKRDEQIKTKGVEVDLSSNMPRLFGQEIADRVVAAFRKGE